ncbi:uncharacterized protein LOC106477750, partial [Limulus polyphemus]|uniref:Uncharacterized protein LOC106477750 n=1 Tax=Limulus polyphemus TaxID=6850 RepID=A0ABM1C3Z0_LIMPO
ISPGENPADTNIVGLPGGAPVGPVGGYGVLHDPAPVAAPVPVDDPVSVGGYAVLHAPGAVAAPVLVNDPVSVGGYAVLHAPGAVAAPVPADAPVPPSPFSFMYTAEGDGSTSSRSESGTVGGEITGSYSLEIGDGRKRALPFNFMYSAPAGGGASSRSESGDVSGNVAGSYSVEDPDGRRRKVDYTAGSGGFRANVQSNEPGVEPGSNPADVEINTYAGLPMIPASGPAGAPALVAAGVPEFGVGGPFDFMYTAPAGGGYSSRSESGDGGRRVKGSYSVEHPSGQKRVVDYSAGDLGFTATVKSNEQGIKPGDNPASVSILSLPGVPAPAAPTPPAPAGAPAAEAPALYYSEHLHLSKLFF